MFSDSFERYDGPEVKTSEQWLALDKKQRRDFARQMDVVGPVQAALKARQEWEYEHPRTDPSRKTCLHCNGTGILVRNPRLLNVFSPSGINRCLRQQYFQYLGIQPKKRWELSDRLTFDIGTKIHELWQLDYLAPLFLPLNTDSGVLFSYEDLVSYTPWDIVGSCDGIFEGPGFRVGLEIKSASTKTIDKLGTKPSSDYLMQNAAYNKCEDLPGSLFLFVEKAWPHRTIQIFNGFDPKMVAAVEEVVTEIRGSMEGGTVPDRTVPAFDCKKCVYYHACKYGEGDL